MPHIILEHNLTDKNLVTELCKDLHKELCKQETVKPETVKSRSIFVNDAMIGGDLKATAFLHVEVKLFSGRPDSLKTKISQTMLAILKSKAPHDTILSAELRELDSYSKYP
jgi:5-carboxymethyl-2-hydroxymuconate isomerase